MSWARLRTPAFLLALAILALSSGALRAAIRVNKIYLQKSPIEAAGNEKFHTLPNDVGEWRSVSSASDKPLSKEVLETLGTENYMSRQYKKKFADREVYIELHCAYYTGMVDTVPHVPETCFVAGGMMQTGQAALLDVPIDVERFPVDRKADPAVHKGVVRLGFAGARNERVHLPRGIEKLKMHVMRFQQGKADVYAGYFFIANGGTVPRAEDVRLLAFNLSDDYAYYAKVQFTSTSVKSVEELASVAGDFLNDMLPEIMRRTPDWVEVVEGRYPPDHLRKPAHAAAK